MTGRPTTWATNAVVATPHHLASQAGLRILQDGGNAVDAAIAANATLNVMYPHQCHIGGDLFAIVWEPAARRLQGLNSSGLAPAGESIDRLRSLGHTSIPERGALTVTVPGTVAGWHALHERYGSLGLDRLLGPAIGYARDGAPMPGNFIGAVQRLRHVLEANDAARDVFLSGVTRPGDIMRQPALAETLIRVGQNGPDGFYRGPVADDIVATLGGGGSVMSHDDLAGFQPEWVETVSTSYRGYELHQLPPNTQGATVLLMASIVEGWDMQALGHVSTDAVHAAVETKLRAFAERDASIADPRFYDVPLERFLDKHLAAAHRDAIEMQRTAATSHPSDDGDTVYLCVVDRDGMAVSLIQSVYQNFGSGVVAPRSGVLFHNRGRGFTLDAEYPNALQPGKRPYHTLIPAMLMCEGRPALAFGTMGADAQAQVQLQLLLGFVDHGLLSDPQAAIEAPRWVSGADAGAVPWLRIEPRFGTDVADGLRSRGHNVVIGEDWDSGMGHAHAIVIDHERGVLGGASDPRSDGAAVGV
ncbi:MAG TPA: gamma-glutamyltransferase [Thermomicrobiales bacterium]|nr:gamma-glutamyltransferase [Thermomicrobiales bacterium]